MSGLGFLASKKEFTTSVTTSFDTTKSTTTTFNTTNSTTTTFNTSSSTTTTYSTSKSTTTSYTTTYNTSHTTTGSWTGYVHGNGGQGGWLYYTNYPQPQIVYWAGNQVGYAAQYMGYTIAGTDGAQYERLGSPYSSGYNQFLGTMYNYMFRRNPGNSTTTYTTSHGTSHSTTTTFNTSHSTTTTFTTTNSTTTTFTTTNSTTTTFSTTRSTDRTTSFYA